MTKALLALLLLLASVHGLGADVFIAPTFSEPAIVGKSLLIRDSESSRVICVSDGGKLQWQRRVKDLMAFGELDDRSFYIQLGRRVSRVVPETGEMALIASLPKGERIVIDATSGAAWSRGGDWVRGAFVFRDSESLRALWRDDRIISIAAIDDTHLFVITALVNPSEGGSFTLSDATLRALDRTTGRELWAYRLHDTHAMEVRAHLREERLAVIDGIMPSEIILLDIRTGRRIATLAGTEAGSDFAADLDWTSSGELAVLQMTNSPEPAALRTYSVPDFQLKGSMPLPAKESLFFFRDGSTVITSGIYSVAAFDATHGRKLWEIDHQVLIRRPSNGRFFGSRSDRERNMAVLESIDLVTGRETTIYEEQLPPDRPPSAKQRRALANAERRRHRDEVERARKEESERLPVGDEICLRYDQSGMLDVREYLLLRRDGRLEYIDADTNFPPRRMNGRWRKVGDSYELDGTKLARDIDAGRLTALMGVRANLTSVPELRDVVEAFQQAHIGQATFTDAEIGTLSIRRPECPPEALSYCDTAGRLLLSVSSRPLYPAQTVTAADIDAFLRAIEAYLHDLKNAGILRFRIRSYRSERYVEWLDPHSYWKSSVGDAEREIDNAIEVRKFGDAAREPALFRLDRCANVAAALAKVGTITTIP